MKAGILAATAMAASALIAQTKAESSLTVTSSAFESGSMIPVRFTCKGENESPPLAFKGIPAGAKSLVLIIDDPDAPGGVFSHWLVWNIDPSVKQIPSTPCRWARRKGKTISVNLVTADRARLRSIGISFASSPWTRSSISNPVQNVPHSTAQWPGMGSAAAN